MGCLRSTVLARADGKCCQCNRYKQNNSMADSLMQALIKSVIFRLLRCLSREI